MCLSVFQGRWLWNCLEKTAENSSQALLRDEQTCKAPWTGLPGPRYFRGRRRGRVLCSSQSSRQSAFQRPELLVRVPEIHQPGDELRSAGHPGRSSGHPLGGPGGVPGGQREPGVLCEVWLTRRNRVPHVSKALVTAESNGHLRDPVMGHSCHPLAVSCSSCPQPPAATGPLLSLLSIPLTWPCACWKLGRGLAGSAVCSSITEGPAIVWVDPHCPSMATLGVSKQT